MAQLCLARQTGSAGFEKRVALKVLHPHMAESEAVVKMFVHEASIAAQLSHPNVVHVLDLGNEGDEYYIAMEYIAGTNVRQLMHRAKRAGLRRVPLWAVVHIAIATCDGLQYIHDFASEDGTPLGLVHRDISPENIMVSFNGAVKLVDFGVLRIEGVHRTGAGSIVGKPHYMAPEQIRDKRLDRRADLFSVGVVLYEALSGHRPFNGDGAAAVLMSILDDDPPPLRQLEPSVPVELERIVMRLLARPVEDRYPDASAVRDDLVAFARSERIARDERSLALLTASLFEESPDIPSPIRRLLQTTSLPGIPRDVPFAASGGGSPRSPRAGAAPEESARSERTEATSPLGALPSDHPRAMKKPGAKHGLSAAEEAVYDGGWNAVHEPMPESGPAALAEPAPEHVAGALDFGTYEPGPPPASGELFRFRSDFPSPLDPAPGPRSTDAEAAPAPPVSPVPRGGGVTTSPPARHAVLFEEGLAHVKTGAYELARDAWEEASRLCPDNRSYATNLKKLAEKLAEKPASGPRDPKRAP